MKVRDPCCGCLSPRDGSTIIAVLQTVSGVGLVSILWLNSLLTEESKTISRGDRGPRNRALLIFWGEIFYSIISLAILVGVVRKNSTVCLTGLAISPIAYAIHHTIIYYIVFTIFFNLSHGGASGAVVISLIYHCYAWWVYISFVNELKEVRVQPINNGEEIPPYDRIRTSVDSDEDQAQASTPPPPSLPELTPTPSPMTLPIFSSPPEGV